MTSCGYTRKRQVLVAAELAGVWWALPLDEASRKVPAHVLVALRTSILASIANRLSNQMLSGWDKRARKQDLLYAVVDYITVVREGGLCGV